MLVDYHEYFYYDETSPSCLRWKVDIYGGRDYKIVAAKKDSVAGSLSKDNHYYRVTLNRKQLKVHKIIYTMFYGSHDGCDIDHRDRNLLNNKIQNLRAVKHRINSRNQKKRSTNTSGITGVHPKYKDGVLCAWIADIRLNDRRVSKTFSVRKYGNAFELACEYRKQMILSEPEYDRSHGS